MSLCTFQKPEASFKLKTIQLLFAYPLTDYLTDNAFSLAVYGTDIIRTLTVAKMFFAFGQVPFIDNDSEIQYRPLTIHIFTDDIDCVEQSLHDEMPGLADSPKYGTFLFHSLNEFAGFDSANYYVSCNDQVSAPASFDETCFFARYSQTEDHFMVFDEKTDSYTSMPKNHIEDLERINLNQKYDNILKKNPCLSFSEAKKKQEKEKEGNIYNYLSSYACSAFLPYRMALFQTSKQQAEDELNSLLCKSDSEKEEDVKYRALVSMEHRRWVCYVLSEGFTRPSKMEFEEKAFKEWMDQKDTKNKKHPCICDAGPNPFYLKNHPESWKDSEFESNANLSDLDKFSIRCHNLLVTRTAEIKPLLETKLDFLPVDDPVIGNYCAVVENIIKDHDYRNFSLYERCRSSLDEYKEKGFFRYVVEVDELIKVFIARNMRKDYSLLDKTIIDALSFDLWHGKKYVVLVTALSGDAPKDVMLPVLMTCEKILYRYNSDVEAQNEEKKIVTSFFESRGLSEKNNRLHFVDEHSLDYKNLQQSVESFLDIKLEDLPNAALAVDCSQKNPADYMIEAIGQFNAYDNISLLREENGVIVDHKTTNSIHCGNEKCYSGKEYIELLDAEYSNVFDNVQITFQEFDNLQRFFFESNDTIDGGSKSGTLWSQMDPFFTKVAKNPNPTNLTEFFGEGIVSRAKVLAGETQNNDIVIISMTDDIVNYYDLSTFLEQLLRNRIIESYSWKGNELYLNSKDSFVRKLFYCVSLSELDERTKGQRIESSSSQEISRFFYLKSQFFDEAELSDQKIKLLKDLEQSSIISDLVFSGKASYFLFNSFYVRKLFQTPGKVLELILYRMLKDQDVFSDVITGVKIDRNRSHIANYAKAPATYHTKNEIDLVLMKACKSFFVSCKSGGGIDKKSVEEIVTVSKAMNASAVLAINLDITKNIDKLQLRSFVERARTENVSLFGSETICNREVFRNALSVITSGETYSVLDTMQS